MTGPAKVTGNAESAVRADILSVGLLSEIDKSVARLSKGAIKVQSRRKIATRTYSGFEFVYRIQAPGKKPLYMAARSIIQRDKGMQVSSYAVSATKAKANLRKFMANTTIKRLP
ncbi:hypothetical protein K1718_11810 [Roseibium porphyridii]|uniref:HK97 gp10 family phage protein n=1 Tax=Roseibium porphyridii TaxID=2866279 RepID=A0ABY8F9W7_9HYPH|nr:hypothetical protein [Roseibium sp. KMA01]WFE92016.1 hypothetical protein K1718_11810 [Roseibium sp. KMA01]